MITINQYASKNNPQIHSKWVHSKMGKSEKLHKRNKNFTGETKTINFAHLISKEK